MRFYVREEAVDFILYYGPFPTRAIAEVFVAKHAELLSDAGEVTIEEEEG